MAAKLQKIKTKRPKTNKNFNELSYVEKIAALSGCSPRYVRYVLSGDRTGESALGQKVLINAELIKESDNTLLKAVKKAAPFGDSKLFIEQ